MRTDGDDAWAPVFAVVSAISVIVLVLLASAGLALVLLPIFLLIIGLTLVFLGWFCYDIVRWRPRHAMSIAGAIALAFGIAYHAPLIARGKDKIAFYARQSEYVQQVEEARAKQTAKGPLQIVVGYEDQSLFVTANSFHFILYDETDGVGPYAEYFWPYKGSSTGVIAVGAPTRMQHLDGHFYSFTTSY